MELLDPPHLTEAVLADDPTFPIGREGLPRLRLIAGQHHRACRQASGERTRGGATAGAQLPGGRVSGGLGGGHRVPD